MNLYSRRQCNHGHTTTMKTRATVTEGVLSIFKYVYVSYFGLSLPKRLLPSAVTGFNMGSFSCAHILYIYCIYHTFLTVINLKALTSICLLGTFVRISVRTLPHSRCQSAMLDIFKLPLIMRPLHILFLIT